MNKTEFVEAIANEAGLTKTDAAKAVKAFTDVVVKAMKDGDKVQLVGFGTFEATKRPERQGINPATGEVLFLNFETKTKAKEIAKELYTKKGYTGDIYCKYIKAVVEGEDGAFEVKHTPSKSAKMGTYICFGVEG